MEDKQMCSQQEMTLEKWVGKFPEIHRARKEYNSLLETIARLKSAAIDTRSALSRHTEDIGDRLNCAIVLADAKLNKWQRPPTPIGD